MEFEARPLSKKAGDDALKVTGRDVQQALE